jgi:hypothetical protein
MVVVGIRTDIRRGGDAGESINLMLSRSCKKLIEVPEAEIEHTAWVVDHVQLAITEVEK